MNMPKPPAFEEIAAHISALFANSPVQDIEKNLRAILSSAFAKLDLVTREEFDVQTKVLARTREKIDALQQQVQQLLKDIEDKESRR